MLKNLQILLFFALVGCTSTSEVISTGPNSYVISSESSISINDGLEKIYEKAKEVCVQQNKEFLQTEINSRGSGGDVPITGLILEFQCLDSGHPLLNPNN
tara:strand:+ start:61 stop:360 length:300 start_codon:yes stop_codon:yes gene_type:complete